VGRVTVAARGCGLAVRGGCSPTTTRMLVPRSTCGRFSLEMTVARDLVGGIWVCSVIHRRFGVRALAGSSCRAGDRSNLLGACGGRVRRDGTRGAPDLWDFDLRGPRCSWRTRWDRLVEEGSAAVCFASFGRKRWFAAAGVPDDSTRFLLDDPLSDDFLSTARRAQ